jgi:hypothetical protein
MTRPLLKITRHYTSASAAFVGSVQVTQSGGNVKTRIYADNAGANPYPGNVMPLDSNGMVSFYVQQRGDTGVRLTLLDAQGNVVMREDNVIPVADHVASDTANDEPAAHQLAYAATITPTASEKVTSVVIGALTGNITIGAPLKAAPGKVIIFSFLQDATGSRTITWNSVFAAAANGAGTANQRGATSFMYDGNKWVQLSALVFK